MRKMLMLLGVAFGLAINLSGQTIANHSFESTDSEKDISNWTINAPEGSEVELDSLQFVEGAKSIRISGNAVAWCRQSIPYKPSNKQPERLRFTASIKTSLTHGYAKLFARVVEDDDRIARYEVMGTGRPSGKSEWTTYYIDIITDSSTKEIRIGGSFDGDGEAYFDNFQVTKVPFGEEVNSDASQIFTQHYLKTIGDNALYKDSVDFEAIEKVVRKLTKTVSTTNDCHAILTYAVSKLKDGHSFIMPAEAVENWQSDDESNQVYASYKLIDRVGYIRIPQFNSDNKKVTEAFADSLQRVIKYLDKAKVNGWVVDVRNNGGGNCWPMIAGIGPILGDGTYGYFTSRDGKQTAWSYLKGAAKEGDSVITKTNSPYEVKNRKRPIAVLMNGGTASSAEVIAVSFVGLPNARSFGVPSYGATTTNNEYKLADGSLLFLCIGVYVSRDMKKFGGKIYPDQHVDPAADNKTDNELQAAIKWIQSKK